MDENVMWTIIFAVIGFVLQLAMIIAGGVWVVAQIKTSTEKLAVNIQHLTKSIQDQKEWLKTVDEKVDAHGERIAIVESRSNFSPKS